MKWCVFIKRLKSCGEEIAFCYETLSLNNNNNAMSLRKLRIEKEKSHQKSKLNTKPIKAFARSLHFTENKNQTIQMRDKEINLSL